MHLSSSSLARIQRGVRIHLREAYQRHRTLLTLGTIYAATRMLAAWFTQMTFVAYGPGFWGFLTQAQLSLGGAYPFLDYWMEYPPLFPWLTVAAYRLSLLLPPWTEPRLWFGTFLRWTGVPFEVGALLLVHALGKRLHPKAEAWRSTLWYGLAFVTLYVPLGWFDALPLFWLLLATYFLLRERPVKTGVAVGVGLFAKPISALALPAAWQRLKTWDARWKLLLATALSFSALMAPFLILNPQMTLAHVHNLFARSSWETIWAFLDGYFGYGLVAPFEQRFDPATAAWEAHPGGNYSLWVTLGFALLGLYLWTRRIDWRDDRRTVAFVALTWSLFSLWSKGYSPQWGINFVPFVALLLPNLRGAIYLGLLGLVLIAEWPVAFTLLAGQRWYLAAVVIWRTLLFVLLTVEFSVIALQGKPGRAWRKGYGIALLLLLTSAGVIGERALGSYVAARLEAEPLQPTVQALEEGPSIPSGVLCREVTICERLTPFTSKDVFWLPDPSSWQAERLPDFTQKHPLLWLVEEYDEETGHDMTLERYLSERYGKVDQNWAGGARISRFVALEVPSAQPVEVTFGNTIHLISYAVRVEGRLVNLALNWKALAPVEGSYKVFVHVRDEGGKIVTQNDQFPGGGFRPTDHWTVGESVRDLHGLLLPAPDLSGFRLHVGVYDPVSGERLPLDGSGRTALEIPLP